MDYTQIRSNLKFHSNGYTIEYDSLNSNNKLFEMKYVEQILDCNLKNDLNIVQILNSLHKDGIDFNFLVILKKDGKTFRGTPLTIALTNSVPIYTIFTLIECGANPKLTFVNDENEWNAHLQLDSTASGNPQYKVLKLMLDFYDDVEMMAKIKTVVETFLHADRIINLKKQIDNFSENSEI